MATYKKKGQKSKSQKIEEKSTTAEVFHSLDEGANRTEAWVAKNQRVIFGIIGIAALFILGYLGYQRFIQAPNEAEASNEMAQAQTHFGEALAAPAAEKDSLFQMALNGNGRNYGFLQISENYSGTDAANLAHYYAGMAYLNTGKYQEAIAELDQFKSDDEILAPLAKGAIGDAFMQLEQPEQALNYYEKAAKMRDNSFTTPKFLLKSAVTAIELGQGETAEKHLKKLKEAYPDAPQAEKVAVYLGQATALK